MTNSLTLHYSIPSRGTVVRWMLEELQVDYNVRLLDMQAEAHKQPEYLQLNPLGRVPTLTHDNAVVTETAGICMYLADRFAEKGLSVPLDSAARGDFCRWIFFAPVTLEPAILWTALAATTDSDYQPYSEVSLLAQTLAAWLDTRAYMVAEKFTAADVVVGGALLWGLQIMPVLPQLPQLVAYSERLQARPAWQRVLAAESSN